MRALHMTMADTSTTITDAALLRLIWLASPALPVGGFSYSEGLEARSKQGLVRDEQSAGDWLVDQLHLTLARGDLAVVAAAVVAKPRARLAGTRCVGAADARDSEFRLQSEQMGRSLSDVGWVAEGTPALRESAGVAARANPAYLPRRVRARRASHGASPRQIALTFAFAWSENMMQSAIKSVPLGQSAGQRILGAWRRRSRSPSTTPSRWTTTRRQAFAPMLAILSARHETQYSRLFRS
jgi:urease accessory protein